MKNYEEICNSLIAVAKREGLPLIKAELEEEMIYLRLKDKVVLNSLYLEREGVAV